MLPDGVSYLDMGDAYWRGDWHTAINTCFSPLYGVLLGAALRLARPSPACEFPLVHAVNFLILIFAALCFDYFWKAIVKCESDQSQPTSFTATQLWALGYALFFSSSLTLISIRMVTPDLLTSAWFYLICGLLVHMADKDFGWRNVCSLGVVLAMGYLTRAPMFLLAFLVLTTAFVLSRKSNVASTKIVVVMLVFCCLAAPLVIAISRKAGHLTFGEAGRFNWIMYINHATDFRYGLNEPAEIGVPAHTARQLLSSPAVYDLESSDYVTYPLWYDPGYWTAGLHPRFDLRSWCIAFIHHLRTYAEILLYREGGLLAVIASFFYWGVDRKALFARLCAYWYLLLQALALLLVYALVHVEPRYIGGSLVVLWCLVIAAQGASVLVRSPRLLLLYTAAAVLYLGAVTIGTVLHDATVPDARQDVAVAEAIRVQGLQPGDKVAVIGQGSLAYWARLDHLRVIAEIPKGAAFWTTDPALRERALTALRETGAKLVIAQAAPHGPPAGWTTIANTGFWETKF